MLCLAEMDERVEIMNNIGVHVGAILRIQRVDLSGDGDELLYYY